MSKKKNTSEAPNNQAEATTPHGVPEAPPGPKHSIPDVVRKDHPALPDGGFDLDAPRVLADLSEVPHDREPSEGMTRAGEGNGSVTPPTEARREQVTTPANDEEAPALVVEEAKGNGTVTPAQATKGEPDPYEEDNPQEEAAEGVLTEQDRADYRTYREGMRGSHREFVVNLREISCRKLWRAEYRRWSDFCLSELGHDKMWASRELKWLRRQERLDSLCKARGIATWPILKEEGEHLAELEDHPEQYVRAMIETDLAFRSKKKDSKRSKSGFMKEQVARQIAYIAGRKKTPDLTWDEFVSLERLGDGNRTTYQAVALIVTEASQARREEMLVAAVKANGKYVPTDRELLQVARGRDLYALVEALLSVRQEWEQDDEIEEAQAKLDLLKKEKAKAKQVEGDKEADEKPTAIIQFPIQTTKDQPEEEESEEESEEEAAIAVQMTGDLAAFWGRHDPRETPHGEEDLDVLFAGIQEALNRSVDERLTFAQDSAVVIHIRKPAREEDVKRWKMDKLSSGMELLGIAISMIEEGKEEMSGDEKAALTRLVEDIANLLE